MGLRACTDDRPAAGLTVPIESGTTDPQGFTGDHNVDLLAQLLDGLD
jgi:hypothetical protein